MEFVISHALIRVGFDSVNLTANICLCGIIPEDNKFAYVIHLPLSVKSCKFLTGNSKATR